MRIIKSNFPLIFSLYIISIFLIPLIGGATKGSSVNTLLKLILLLVFFVCTLVASRFKISKSILPHSAFFLFLLSQFFCFLDIRNINAISSLGQIVISFLFLLVIPTIRQSEKSIIKGLIVFLIFNYFSIVYNLIIHFDFFISFQFLSSVNYRIYSFFDNKNTFGMVLFIGLVLLFYLKYLSFFKGKYIFRLLLFVQLFAIAFSMCRTSLLCSVLFIFGYLIINYKRYFSLTLFIMVLGMVSFFVPFFRNMVFDILLRVDVGTYRDVIYEGAIKLIASSPVYGYGVDNWADLLLISGGNTYSHNGFLTILLDGGIINSLSYLLVIVFSFRSAWKIRFKNAMLSKTILLYLLCFLIYSYFESVVLCSSSAVNSYFTFAGVVVPILIFNKSEKSNIRTISYINCFDFRENYKKFV